MNVKNIFKDIGERFFYHVLSKELKGMSSVLDVGCGELSPLRKVNKNFHLVGVDAYRPSIEKSKKLKIHDKYKVTDVLSISKIFPKKSFDAVVALDIIEHLNKKEGFELINQMEKLAKKKIIILTPFGFTTQHPIDGNPFQAHKSGWYIKDFKKKSFKVYGLRGFRFIRGEYATIKYEPWIFWGILASFSELIVYHFPNLAYHLLAVKKINI